MTDSDDDPVEDFASVSGNGKEWVFLSIKKDVQAVEENVTKEKALGGNIEDKDEWVIDSGCSHHMTGVKRKFLYLQEFDGILVIFGYDKACMVKGKGAISLDGKHNTDNVYFVGGLKHNLLSVGNWWTKAFNYSSRMENAKSLIDLVWRLQLVHRQKVIYFI